MMGDIVCDVIISTNLRLEWNGRSGILSSENAGHHHADLEERYGNIKAILLPSNTASKLQPLDVGIVMNFRLHCC